MPPVFRIATLLLASLSASPLFATDGLCLQAGQRVAFVGDSITWQGGTKPAGYVNLVVNALETNGVRVVAQPAGVSGDTSKSILRRLDRVLAEKPDWLTLSCGVNDVWKPEQIGVSLEDYKATVTAIINKSEAAGTKVIILTATPIGEDLDNPKNVRLATYNDFLRTLAKEKGCPLADLNADFQTALRTAAPHKGNLFTVDGVHMNPQGNIVMAAGVLRAIGLPDDKIIQAKESWRDIPGGATEELKYPGNTKKGEPVLIGNAVISMRQAEQLKGLAERKKIASVRNLFANFYNQNAKALVQPGGPYIDVAAIFAAQKEKEVQADLQAKLNGYVKQLLEER